MRLAASVIKPQFFLVADLKDPASDALALAIPGLDVYLDMAASGELSIVADISEMKALRIGQEQFRSVFKAQTEAYSAILTAAKRVSHVHGVSSIPAFVDPAIPTTPTHGEGKGSAAAAGSVQGAASSAPPRVGGSGHGAEEEVVVGWNAVEQRPAHLDLPLNANDITAFREAVRSVLREASGVNGGTSLESGRAGQPNTKKKHHSTSYTGAGDYIRPVSLSFFMLMRSEKTHPAAGCSHAIAQPDLFELRATFTTPLKIRLGYGDTMMIIKALDILEAPPPLYTRDAAPADSQDDVFVDACHLTGQADAQGAILAIMHRSALDSQIRREDVRGRFAATLLVLASLAEFVDRDFVQLPYTFREVGRAVADYKHGLEALQSEIRLVHPEFRPPS